ncbi:MAG: hypothetical protein KAZ26_05885 [Caldilineaceae bacterium]|nr:hypothetical protein [Caldilineaceae bacterium]
MRKGFYKLSYGLGREMTLRSEQTSPVIPPIQKGDQISAHVGDGASNVVIGKDIQQTIISHVDQIIIQQPLAASRSATEIPELLVYKVDREFQERHLVRSMSDLQQQTSHPIICIIHGGKHEAHDSFVKRLSHDYLPKQMGLSFTPGLKSFLWPSGLEQVSTLADELQRKVSDAVCGNYISTPAQINQTLNRHSTYVLYSVMYQEDLRNWGFEIVEEFLHFWQKWPQLSAGQILFVCLCIKYDMDNAPPPRAGFFSRFLQRKNTPEPVHILLEEALDSLDFSQYEQIKGIPLPRLESVEQMHLENWARREETQQYCNSTELFREIRTLYDAQQGGQVPMRIPMDIVQENLRRILNQYRNT